MPTHAQTKIPPLAILPQAKREIKLGFNQGLKIDVFQLGTASSDSTELEDLFSALDVSKINPSQMDLSLFGVSQELQDLQSGFELITMLLHFYGNKNKTPGLHLADDQEVLEYIKTQMSDNITNPDTIIQELITAWNNIANNPLFAEHKGIKSNQETTNLTFFANMPAVYIQLNKEILTKVYSHEKIQQLILATVNKQMTEYGMPEITLEAFKDVMSINDMVEEMCNMMELAFTQLLEHPIPLDSEFLKSLAAMNAQVANSLEGEQPTALDMQSMIAFNNEMEQQAETYMPAYSGKKDKERNRRSISPELTPAGKKRVEQDGSLVTFEQAPQTQASNHEDMDTVQPTEQEPLARKHVRVVRK